MEDILHQLVGSLSRYLQGFMALRWSCSFFPWFMITTQTCPFCVFVIEFKFPFPNQTGTSKQTNKQRSKEAKKQRKTNKQRNKQPNKQRHEPFFPGPNRPALPRIILRPKTDQAEVDQEQPLMGWNWLETKSLKKHWLVVSTHLKILVKMDHFPSRGEHKKYLKPPPRSPWRNTFEHLASIDFYACFPGRRYRMNHFILQQVNLNRQIILKAYHQLENHLEVGWQ